MCCGYVVGRVYNLQVNNMAKKKKEHITFNNSRNNHMSYSHVNKKGKAPSFNKMHNTKNK